MAELTQASVARACLVGIPGVVDNEYVLDCAKAANGRLVPIAGVDPFHRADLGCLEGDLAALAQSGFAGIKLHPRLNGYDPVDPRCLETIRAAAAQHLVVFLDTLFRQRQQVTAHAADVVDRIAHECAGATIVLLHAGGPALLELAEVVRLHQALVLDLSFTLLYYEGSSLDADLRWVMERLDRRLVIGSDMPEFTPAAAFERAERLACGLAAEKWAHVAFQNLERLFPSGSTA